MEGGGGGGGEGRGGEFGLRHLLVFRISCGHKVALHSLCIDICMKSQASCHDVRCSLVIPK